MDTGLAPIIAGAAKTLIEVLVDLLGGKSEDDARAKLEALGITITEDDTDAELVRLRRERGE